MNRKIKLRPFLNFQYLVYWVIDYTGLYARKSGKKFGKLCLLSSQKKQNINILLLTLALSFIFSTLYGQQNKSDIPYVVFKNRVFETDLTYGRPFFIKTSTQIDGKSANICAVKVWSKETSDKDTLYAYDWIHREDKRTDFEIKINKGLSFDKVYFFEFVYLLEEAYSADPSILKKIIHRSHQFFKQRNLAITGHDVDTIINNIEIELIKSAKYTSLDFDSKGKWILRPQSVKLFKFPITTSKGLVTADDFALLAREQFLLEEELERKKRELLQLKMYQNDYVNLLKNLIDNNRDFGEALSRIIKFIESGNPNNTSNYDFQSVSEIKCSEECVQSIRNMRILFVSIASLDRDIISSTDNIRYLENKMGSLSEITQAGIKLSNIISTESYININDKSTFDKVKIGTAFGGSFAFPNTSSFKNIGTPSTFGYFSLKFYLRPVDKGLKCPYLSSTPILNRTSVFVGLKALGNLEYKGIQLKNVFGTQPLLGVSYDIHRNFSIDIGAVLFRQASVYPLISRDSPPRAAFTIGLSFDPDLINRFRTLFLDEKYKIN